MGGQRQLHLLAPERLSNGFAKGAPLASTTAHPPALAPRAYPPLPLARGRQANLRKMTPKERGTTLGKFRSEYIVYGDFLCEEPYVLATSAKLIKNVTRATALDEVKWRSSARTSSMSFRRRRRTTWTTSRL